jgi:hypothetical protein
VFSKTPSSTPPWWAPFPPWCGLTIPLGVLLLQRPRCIPLCGWYPAPAGSVELPPRAPPPCPLSFISTSDAVFFCILLQRGMTDETRARALSKQTHNLVTFPSAALSFIVEEFFILESIFFF